MIWRAKWLSKREVVDATVLEEKWEDEDKKRGRKFSQGVLNNDWDEVAHDYKAKHFIILE